MASSNYTYYNVTMSTSMSSRTDLDPGLTALMFTIILLEILGAISNIICIYIVSRIKKSQLISRPKVLMANIALSDTVLMIVTIVPRFVILSVIQDNHPMAAHVIQSIRGYLENTSLHVEAITMALIACDRWACSIESSTSMFGDVFGLRAKRE